MIIKAYKQEDEIIHGNVESVECTIKTDDAKLFHILSNLYSRPLDAVVREVSTNCLDGHRVVGKEKVPFHITINDSKLDDELSVQFRDFGPGMSKETIVKVFSTFGESTKINSNLETGCLGLGSKSPFAVTTTFMVISYIDNIKYVYNMSKDAVGRPKITLFTESYTEEPNGMEISIPLNRNSYNKHQILEAIRKELYFFRTKPKVFVNTTPQDIKFPKKNYIKSYRGCYFVNSRNTSTDFSAIENSRVIQGEVSYPFRIEDLLNYCKIDNTLSLFEVGENNSLSQKTSDIIEKVYSIFMFHMFFDNGSFSFAPSREDVLYDPSTIQNILDKCLKNTIKLFKQFHKMMNEFSAPETAKFTNGRLNFSPTFDPKTINIFFGKIARWEESNKFRELYISAFDYLYEGDLAAYKQKCIKYGFDYIKESKTDPNIKIFLNQYGNMVYSKVDNFILSSGDNYLSETINVIKCRYSTNNTFINHIQINSGKLKVYDSTNVLQSYNRAAVCFININTAKIKSYKPKIEDWLKLKQYDNSAEKLGIDELYLVRYSNPNRIPIIMQTLFGQYGIDYKQDLKIIEFDVIEKFIIDKELAIKENAKLQRLAQGLKEEEVAEEEVAKKSKKEDITYYYLTRFSSANKLNNRIHDRKSCFGYNSGQTMSSDGTNDSRIKIKDLLYIPLDNKKKNMEYILSHVNSFINYDMFFEWKTRDDSDGNPINYKKNIESWYTGVDYILKTKYKKDKHPFYNKHIIVMNADKAEKLGIRSFEKYFKRTIEKVIDYTKYKKSIKFFETSTYDLIEKQNICFHQFAEAFKLNGDVVKLNCYDLKSYSRSDAEEIAYRKQELDNILTRFTNIELKMHQSEITTKIFDFFRNDIITNQYLKNHNVIMIFQDHDINARSLVKIIKSVPKNKKVNIDVFEYNFDKELKNVVYEILQLGRYLFSAVENSWELPYKSSSKTSRDSKIQSCTRRIDEMLLYINKAIINASNKSVTTFIDPEIIDLGESDIEKEVNATDVA